MLVDRQLHAIGAPHGFDDRARAAIEGGLDREAAALARREALDHEGSAPIHADLKGGHVALLVARLQVLAGQPARQVDREHDLAARLLIVGDLDDGK